MFTKPKMTLFEFLKRRDIAPSVKLSGGVAYTYTNWGAGIALSITGEKTNVQRVCNRLFNVGATSSEPIWLNDNPKQAKAYILTDRNRLTKGMRDIFIISCIRRPKMAARFKGKEGGAKKLTQFKAEQWVSEVPIENFLDESAIADIQFSVVGGESGGDEE